jgi:exodeoxyribonuclease-3
VSLHQENTGYHLCIMGQKQFNGVAILSEQPMNNVLYTLPECPDSLYRSKKHLFKKWLYLRLIQLRNTTSLCLCIFYTHVLNNLPAKTLRYLSWRLKIFATNQDLYNPTANMWNEYCMKTAKERDALELLLSLGYTDLYAFYYPVSQFRLCTRWQHYSTQQDQKHVYRIDLIILPTSSIPYVTDTTVHTAYRALPDSSDHATMSVTLNLNRLFRKSQYVHNVYTVGGERENEGNASLVEA